MMLPSCVASYPSCRFCGRVAAFASRQPEMIAQCCPSQRAAIAAARFQRRDYVADKIVEPFCLDRETEDETIGPPGVEPADQLVCNLFARADELRLRRRHFQGDLAQVRAILLRFGLDAVRG